MKKTIYLLATLVLTACTSVFSQAFKEAISKKDTVLAAQLLKKGADINAADDNGVTPLMNACRWGDTDMVRWLLDHKANPNDPRSAKRRTPLMVACAYWSGPTVCKLLLAKGAKVNEVSDGGITALMLAAQNCKLEVVQMLLEKGADAKHTDATGKTALDYAKAAEVQDYMKTSIKDCTIDKAKVIGILEL